MSRYPFGLPVVRRVPRRPASGTAALFVLGVSPGALQIRWQRPDGVVAEALAVADEPTVFWDGADAGKRVSRWKERVGWRPAWGSVNPAGTNGGAGKHVNDHVLGAFGLTPDDVWFTDCLPTYSVKPGKNSQLDVYHPFAATQDPPLPDAELPLRPSPSQLVSNAVTEEGVELRKQLLEADAPAVVTLGQEAADVLAALTGADRVVLAPDADYGREHEIAFDGHKLRWTALTDPANHGDVWQQCHARWVLNHSAGGVRAE